MAAGDITVKYGTPTALTLTLASLATSSTRVAGRASTVVTKADPETDHLLSGFISTGTSPTVDKQIDVWIYAQHDDGPTYPDGITGSDAAQTMTSVNVRNSAMRWAASIRIDNTTARKYWLTPLSIAALFGGKLPKRWGVFISHDTAVNLNSTGGNHELKYTPVYENVAAS